ncbi:ras di-ras and rheb family members of small gtpase superfamily [Anaeramoeba flamelloides]|uniref:Ras di-ras and rheb family members of small gtpase superfamily n=1 Tax=Anaeramoeba flamelloides TaxID=1746091 RepID=A0AAV7YVT9_9EUKA|nr:ras di-ras and rheb family members of small gtpase superfamily [Anaeramoeba flamelloides]
MSETRFTIAVAGPGSVGKSAITLQFITQTFVRDYDPTIEECYRKQIQVDGQSVYLEIQKKKKIKKTLNIFHVYQTTIQIAPKQAGQEEYSTLRTHNFMNADGFVLVYSVDNRKAFEDIDEFRGEIHRAKDSEMVPIILCANKIDLPKELHEVTKKEGQDLAKSFGIPFMETSAKQVINIDEAFIECVRLVKKKNSLKGKKTKSKKDCVIM